MEKAKIEIEIDKRWLAFLEQVGKHYDLTVKELLEQELDGVLRDAECWYTRGYSVEEEDIRKEALEEAKETKHK